MEASTRWWGILLEALAQHNLPQERLRDETLTVMLGGIGTTSEALIVAMYHLLENKEMVSRLRKELRGVMVPGGNPVSIQRLHSLPYLTAVVNETLPVAIGAVFRSPRIAPEGGLVYKGYVIPAGTAVAVTRYFVMRDPTIFPKPTTFNPDRWIQVDEDNIPLKQYLVPFGKGPRQCVAKDLGLAVLYSTLAAMVHRLDMELHHTVEKDIAFAREYIIPFPENGRLKLDVTVEGILNPQEE